MAWGTPLLDAFLLPFSLYRSDMHTMDDNAKDGDQGSSDLHVVLTMILSGTNFCIW